MSSNTQSVSFQKLQEKYIINLSKNLNKMCLDLQNNSILSLAESLHKLKGNGQTYGFKEISEIATLAHQHYKFQSSDFLKFAQIGVNLLQQIYPLLLERRAIDLDAYPEYRELVKSNLPFQEKGAS